MIMVTAAQLLAFSGVLILAITLALVWIYQSLKRATLDSGMSARMASLVDRTDLLDDQLNAIRRELAGLKESMGEAEPIAREAESSYAAAMRLAQKGMDSAEVAAGCGISRGEAELIVALYRASQRS